MSRCAFHKYGTVDVVLQEGRSSASCDADEMVSNAVCAPLASAYGLDVDESKMWLRILVYLYVQVMECVRRIR